MPPLTKATVVLGRSAGGRWEVREEAACMRGVQGTLDVAQEHPELDSGARQ